MQAEPREESHASLEARRRAALELCFIAFVGLSVAAAFIAALSYDFISARAPLVVMVPLLLLIGVQITRTLKLPEAGSFVREISSALRGQSSSFNIVAEFIGMMALLLFAIYLVGHYVGVSIFMLLLLRRRSKESWLLSLVLTIGVTLSIYLLFEHGFNIELHRGYFFRLWAPY